MVYFLSHVLTFVVQQLLKMNDSSKGHLSWFLCHNPFSSNLQTFISLVFLKIVFWRTLNPSKCFVSHCFFVFCEKSYRNSFTLQIVGFYYLFT